MLMLSTVVHVVLNFQGSGVRKNILLRKSTKPKQMKRYALFIGPKTQIEM